MILNLQNILSIELSDASWLLTTFSQEMGKHKLILSRYDTTQLICCCSTLLSLDTKKRKIIMLQFAIIRLTEVQFGPCLPKKTQTKNFDKIFSPNLRPLCCCNLMLKIKKTHCNLGNSAWAYIAPKPLYKFFQRKSLQ